MCSGVRNGSLPCRNQYAPESSEFQPPVRHHHIPIADRSGLRIPVVRLQGQPLIQLQSSGVPGQCSWSISARLPPIPEQSAPAWGSQWNWIRQSHLYPFGNQVLSAHDWSFPCLKRFLTLFSFNLPPIHIAFLPMGRHIFSLFLSL